MPKQYSARLPQITHGHIDELAQRWGMTKTQVVILAIDRIYREFHGLCPIPLSEDAKNIKDGTGD